MRLLLPQPSNGGCALPPPVPFKKLPKALVVCEPCRKRRTKCDTNRPCSECIKREIDCRYDVEPNESRTQARKRKLSELQNQQTSHVDLYNLLQSRPQDDAAAILQHIRSGASVQAVLQHIREGDLLLQLSLIPETRRRYEFPDNLDMPVCFSSGIGSAYLRSLAYELRVPEQIPRHDQQHTSSLQYKSQYLRPFHSAELVEVLLSDTKISSWTYVSTNEDMLRQLMQHYFLHQFQFWPFFHKDYFLKDLKAGKKRFCSSLLTNAILADATHSYNRLRHRNEPWNPHNLGYKFLAEARRLWELESGEKNITTIQAALVMNMCVNMNGLDKIGWSYLGQAIQMARTMNLFVPIEVKSKKMEIVRHFTAWALFAWQVVSTYQFFVPPLLPEPPKVPLPDPTEYHTWYGEVWVKYPQDSTLIPSHHPYVFYSTCRFRCILNDISKSFGQSKNGLSLEETFQYYERLRSWFRELPDCLNPARVVLPAQLKVHIHYYAAVIGLFQPHINARWNGFPETPQDIIYEAETSLEIIHRIYYLRHSFETYDPVMAFFLSVFGFLSIEKLKQSNNEPDKAKAALSAIKLAAKGINDQGRHCHIARVIARLFCNAMDPSQAHLLKDVVATAELETGDRLLRHIRSNLPVSIVSNTNDAQAKRIDSLIKGITGTEVDSDGHSTENE